MLSLTRRARLALALAGPALLLALSGCSAGGQPGEAGSGEAASEAKLQTWMVDYAACMREQGIDYPEPKPNSGGMMEAFSLDDLGGVELFEAANRVCSEQLGEAPLPEGVTPLTDAEMREQSLEIAACLRKAGADVPDPDSSGALMLPDEISEDAMAACGIGSVGAPAGE